MILDQLIEKKNVLAYINFRIRYLNATFDVTMHPEADREALRQRHRGRIQELELLRQTVANNAVQKMSKIYCGGAQVVK